MDNLYVKPTYRLSIYQDVIYYPQAFGRSA